MQVQVIINSACGLKNVNWRYDMLHPYAVVWIDTSRKCSTKVDMHNGMNPVWGEKFTIALPPTSFMETAILCIDIIHANAPAGTKPLVGSARFQLSAVLNEARAHGNAPLCLNLLRPSRRPQGSVEINIRVKDSNIGHINQYNPQQTPYKQQVAAQPQPQVQMQPKVQFQPQPQVQAQGQFQPQPQVIQQGQYQPRPVVEPQVQYQQQPQVLRQGQSQPRAGSKQNPKVQPVVSPPNSNKPVRPTPAQGPNNRPVRPTPAQGPNNRPGQPTPAQGPNNRPVQPTPAQGPNNKPARQQVNPRPVQQQYNASFGMGPRANVAMQNRDMLIAQNQIGQFMSNLNSNAAPGAAGANDNGETKNTPGDNGETKSAPGDNGEINSATGTDNTVDKSNTESVEETQSAVTFNDAESMHLSYDETPTEPVGSENGGQNYSEYATEEQDNGGNNANAGVVEDVTHEEYGHGGYDENSGVVEDATHEEQDNGGYDANAGEVEYATNEEYGDGGYDENSGVVEDATHEEYGHGGYDANAGEVEYATNEEYGQGGYDANAGEVEYATHEEYGHEGYDANTGVGEYANEEYGHEGYDENAGMEYGDEGYDVNAGTECDYGAYENGDDYANEPCDGAGLESHVDCGEVEVASEY
ncbi:uncharacterized protein LOC144543717 isoform X13 [Carex rostrata]